MAGQVIYYSVHEGAKMKNKPSGYRTFRRISGDFACHFWLLASNEYT
jgi:hypothetical protein